jgi:hypothetical protein
VVDLPEVRRSNGKVEYNRYNIKNEWKATSIDEELDRNSKLTGMSRIVYNKRYNNYNSIQTYKSSCGLEWEKTSKISIVM